MTDKQKKQDQLKQSQDQHLHAGTGAEVESNADRDAVVSTGEVPVGDTNPYANAGTGMDINPAAGLEPAEKKAEKTQQ